MSVNMSDNLDHIIFPWIFNLKLNPHLKTRLNHHMTREDEILDELNEAYADRADCGVLVDALNYTHKIHGLVDKLIAEEAALRDGIERTLKLQESDQRRSLRMRVRRRIEEDEDNLPLADPRFLEESTK